MPFTGTNVVVNESLKEREEKASAYSFEFGMAERMCHKDALARDRKWAVTPSFIAGPFTTIKVDTFLLQSVDARTEKVMKRYELMAEGTNNTQDLF
ncbi:hypothetical protein PsorP6_000692 [Peronosclerospora sorghi]|uniref:Uncharacterized protein n=1 Tax=Peronosclerospora sorghi TaxID=230839 RepID=A0ACC0WTB7_9STRA|nr:hypothetical protein PsorP6_000692 [Peronosclerospora sorghi]